MTHYLQISNEFPIFELLFSTEVEENIITDDDQQSYDSQYDHCFAWWRFEIFSLGLSSFQPIYGLQQSTFECFQPINHLVYILLVWVVRKVLEARQFQSAHDLYCHFLYIIFSIAETKHIGGLWIWQFADRVKTFSYNFAHYSLPVVIFIFVDI